MRHLLVGAIRSHLTGGGLPTPLRTAAEAALVAELADGLRHGAYAEVEALVASYGEAVEDEEMQRSVALHAAMADEAAGRTGAALARVEGVLAGLDPETQAEKVAALSRIADALSEQAGRPVDGRATGGRARSTTASQSIDAAQRGTAAAGFALEAAYPNPGSGRVVLPVTLAEATEARVAVYDVLGREVAVVHEGRLGAGAHDLALDANELPAGVYVVRVAAGEHVASEQITVVR